MASVPVIAAHPSANPRSSRNSRAKPAGLTPWRAVAGSTSSGAVIGSGPAPPCTFQSPMPMSASIIAIKAYVGRLKATPDSRTPRRFTSISKTIATTPMATVWA